MWFGILFCIVGFLFFSLAARRWKSLRSEQKWNPFFAGVFFSLIGILVIYFFYDLEKPKYQNGSKSLDMKAAHQSGSTPKAQRATDSEFKKMIDNLGKTPIAPPDPKPAVETEAQYKSSCKKIVYKDDERGIFYKEFLKAPKKFNGSRIYIPGKILIIEEENNITAIQMHITSRVSDLVLVAYSGSIKVYEGDIIEVWGEGRGVFEGENALGARVSQPYILGKYIKKYVEN